MSAPQHCLSCDRPNPSDAAFCERCGSPLNLKLCEQCEAINESRAERCHQCNATFVAPVVTTRARRVPRSAIALGLAALTGLGGGLAAAYVVTRPKPPAVPTVAKPLPVPVVHAIEQPVAAAKPKPVADRQYTPYRAAEAAVTPAMVIEPPTPPALRVSRNPPVTHTKPAMDAIRTGSDAK
jgi:ribosomal protein L40E